MDQQIKRKNKKKVKHQKYKNKEEQKKKRDDAELIWRFENGLKTHGSQIGCPWFQNFSAECTL